MAEQETKIKPLNGYVIIQYEKVGERKTKSGILMAVPTKQPIPNSGIVYAVADDVSDVKVGDKILFKREFPTGFRIDELELIPVHKDEIQAILVEETE